jgi:hypothetical protein
MTSIMSILYYYIHVYPVIILYYYGHFWAESLVNIVYLLIILIIVALSKFHYFSTIIFQDG